MRRSIRRCSLMASMLVVLAGCASSPTLPSVPSSPVVAQASPSTSGSALPSTAPASSPTALASPPIFTASPRATATSTAAPSTTHIPQATQRAAASSNGIIVYSNVVDGSLHALDLATNTNTTLADPTGAGTQTPWKLAPNGRSIVLIQRTNQGAKDYGAFDARLWVVNIDGSNPRKLLDLSSAKQGNSTLLGGSDLRQVIDTLVWTPDGHKIIAISTHEAQADLYAVAVDGSGMRRLSNTPDYEFDVHVSPDGQDLAYASVGTFGTGGGWSNASAWVQSLADGARQSLIGSLAVHLPSDPNGIAKPLSPTSIDVLGWTNDNSALAQTGNNGIGTSAFWLTTPGNEPRAVVETGLVPSRSFAWDQQAGVLAVAAPAGNKADPATTLRLWTALDGEVQNVGAVAAFMEPHWSPDGTALLVCSNPDGAAAPAHLWRDGTQRALAPARCEQRAWAADGSFALSGNAPRNDAGPNGLPPTAGKVFSADGTPVRDLPVGAMVVGWQNDALLFFAPENDGLWQLRRMVGDQDEGVGEPIAAPPFAPTLLPTP